MQIAFIFTQLLERGSLLRQLVADLGTGARAVFGSWSNIAQLLREAMRYCLWPEEYFDRPTARKRWLGLDSS